MRSDVLGNGISVGRFNPAAPATIALSVSSASVQLKPNTYYRIWSSVDAFFNFGGSSVSVSTASGHPIKAGIPDLHYTDVNNNWVAAVVATGSGTIYFSEYDAEFV